MNFILAWLVSFVYIGAKAYQQRVVMSAQYRLMPPMSYIMAFCETFVTVNIVKHYDNFDSLALLAFCLGTGAWMGSMFGTYMHTRGGHASRQRKAVKRTKRG